MTDRERDPKPLRATGDGELRRMIAASDRLPAPSDVQRRVRDNLADALDSAGVQASIRSRFRPPRWAVAALVILAAGTAVAVVAGIGLRGGDRPVGRARDRDRSQGIKTPRPPAAPVAIAPLPTVDAGGEPLRSQQVEIRGAEPVRITPEAARPRDVAPAARAARPPVPVGAARPVAVESRAPEDVRSPASPPVRPVTDEFVLDWSDRRQARLSLASGANAGTWHLAGVVNGVRVDLEIKRGMVTGHIGDELLTLWFRGDVATGTIRGHDVSFVARPIETGHLVRGEVPGHSVRAELTAAGLSWFPGCEEILPPAGRNAYAGRCAGDRSARVSIPDGFFAMPYLPRMVLLGILLTERDPIFDRDEPRLFPPLRRP